MLQLQIRVTALLLGWHAARQMYRQAVFDLGPAGARQRHPAGRDTRPHLALVTPAMR